MSKTVELRTYDPAAAAVFFKTNERFGGLSNMAGGYPLCVNGVAILSSEALYQACRFPHLPAVQRLIIEQRSPMTAKMKSKPYRDQSRADWDKIRVRVMRWCLRVKLAQNWTRFGDLLRSTDDLPIVELSYKDDFWGAKPQENRTLVGMNVLGRLLMELRAELKAATDDSLHRVEPIPIPDFLLYEAPIGVVEGRPRTAAPVLDRPQEATLWDRPAPPLPEEAPEVTAAPPVPEAADCYSLCLPLILHRLRNQESTKKDLAGIAKSLDVLPKQLEAWVERAIREGRILKTRRGRKDYYTLAPSPSDSTLRSKEGDAA